jgi:CHAT domain-containing protein/tetratricopeptide (TPR) repeat protein
MCWDQVEGVTLPYWWSVSSVSALFCTFLLCVYPASSQQPVPADLAQGKDLIARLSRTSSPDPSADAVLFQQLGIARSEKVLLAVVANGSGSAATADDWAGMHRAFDALIELNAGQQQLFKASIYANLQDTAYRYDEGDYVAALGAARQALDLQQRAGQTVTLSIPWKNVGEDLIHLGRIDEGASALYQARKLIQDPTAPLAADLWGEIISLESSRGNPVAAHNESEAFLRAAGATTPAAFRSEALLAAANVAMDDHRYEDAVARIHEAVAAQKGAPDTTLVTIQALNALLSLTLEAMQSMPYDQALSLCDRLDKEFPGLPVSISEFAREIGNHRRRLAGQFDAVLREDSAQLDRARAASDLSAQVAALLTTAVDYAYLRESTLQVAALEQAAEILHSPSADAISPFLRFRVLTSLGAAQLADGDPQSALGCYAEVLAGIEAISSARMRSQLGPIYADAQLGRAAVLERTGDLKGARELLRQALDPAPGSLAHFTRSAVLLQQARLEQSAKQQPGEVLRLYLEAIAALHQEAALSREKDINTEVYARLQLVHYLATTAPPDASHNASLPAESFAAIAGEQLELVRSASTSIGLADATWRIQFLQGILDENAGDSAGAMRSYSAAVDAVDRIRAGLSEQEERQSFIDSASVQELYRRQIELLTAKGDRDQAWEFLERDKARSFLESLRGRHFAVSPSASTTPLSKASIAKLDGLEQQILAARLALSPEGVSTLRDSGRLPEVVHAQLVSLEASFALARQQQTLVESRAAQPLALRPASIVATQARLPAHTALIEYAILEHELAAFVVTHTSATELHWPADTAALPAQLLKLSKVLAFPRASEDDVDAQLSAVSDVVLVPILRALAPDIDTLIIVPTQSLSLIPFQALPLPRSGSLTRGLVSEDATPPASVEDLIPRTLLIDRYAVAYLPSASTLQFLAFGPPSASPDLFLGALGEVSVEGLPVLPGTLDETAAIQKLYPHAILVTGPAFTHQVAVKALLEHQEVHFATHGLFEEKAPLFSALITAPAPGQPSRLSLFEVMDLNLKARLVILSGCETDRGQLTGGDEIEGLTRTFLQAGADNVVSSLWSVSDESTALLMQSLHAHLRAGESTPLALRHAELQVRRKFPQPFYWAAFVDTGVR